MIIKQKNIKIKNDEIIIEYWKSINNQKKCMSHSVFIYRKKNHKKLHFHISLPIIKFNLCKKIKKIYTKFSELLITILSVFTICTNFHLIFP